MYGAAPGLHPRRAHRIRHPAHRVLVHHRPVPRVLERHRLRAAPLHRDRLAHRPHRLPGSAVAVLRAVGGIHLVHVQVLAVGAEDREPPGPVLVMPDRHPRHRRLAAADHVPPRGHQVHEVAQRGCRLRPVRVVGHDGPPVQREARTHHPVVAPDVAPPVPGQHRVVFGTQRRQATPPFLAPAIRRLHVGRLEAHRGAIGVVQVQDRLEEPLLVDARVQVQRGLSGAGVEPLDPLQQVCTVTGHEATVVQLLGDVS